MIIVPYDSTDSLSSIYSYESETITQVGTVSHAIIPVTWEAEAKGLQVHCSNSTQTA